MSEKLDCNEQFAKSLAAFVERQYGTIEECEETESPIEAMMFFALSVVGEFHDGMYLSINTQHQLGNYRADFLVTMIQRNATGELQTGAAVIVECDGHEFHEKTKSQAKHDKRRDRFIQSLGFNVLRFTGSEIWEDCMSCAEEVIRFLRDKGREAK